MIAADEVSAEGLAHARTLKMTSVDPTNGTSISESLYCVWVYVKIDGHCVKVRTGEKELIKPNSLCFIPNVMSHIST